jgi:hypothetical protein
MSAISRIPAFRDHDNEIRMGHLDDLHFVLTHTDGLDDDDVFPHGVHHIDDVDGGLGEASQVPPGGQAFDENALVERVFLHADAIAQDCPSGERAGGVDGDDPDGLSLLSE